MNISLIYLCEEIFMYGVGTLSACLKKEGHNVQIIFMTTDFSEEYPNESLNELVELSKDSELIGISMMTVFFKYGVQITETLKSALNIPVLWGGIHPTVQPEECLAYADMVCVGEGEEALVELVTKMENGQDYYDVPGMWFKENGKIIKNPMRRLIQNLDTIPLPDNGYENKYIRSGRHICAMNEDLLSGHPGKRSVYKTLPTRGCLFECTYCVNSAFKKLFPKQNHIRKRSLDNVLRELMEVKNAESIKFVDDHFLSYTEEEIEEFCRKYKNIIKLPLQVLGVSPATFNRKKVALLVDAGLTHLRIGIQTGSENTKKLYKRRHSNKYIIDIAKVAHEFRIDKLSYDIIIDNPWESDEDIIETLMLLTRIPVPYQLNLFSLRLYPGTALYEMAKSNGIIIDEYCGDFKIYKKTYLNKLFFLMKTYAKRGKILTPEMMSLLTSPMLRRLKLHWLLYGITKMKLIMISWASLKDIKKKYKKKKRKRISKKACEFHKNP
jgi:radical SAM superfamily enzyme YgiQ (UPF0313 family)